MDYYFVISIYRYYFYVVDEYDKQAADSLLPIISSQRERFRTRNLELEAVSLENINPEAITQKMN